MANIWTQMSYTPPRGPCCHKTSLVTTCACHRFMIHPLKLASSFSCDGCGHHASFHQMESKEDEEVARRWRNEVEEEEGRRGHGGLMRIEEGPKRRRIADKPEEEVIEVEDLGGGLEGRAGVSGRKRKGRGV